MYSYIVLILFLVTTNEGQFTKLDSQHSLIEYFLSIKNLDIAIFYTSCWSLADKEKIMKNMNEKKIAISHRNKEDFDDDFNLKDSFTLSIYSPTIGVIFDWSCNDDVLFKFSNSWLWNSSYHWLMLMENNTNKNIQSFLASKKINLTICSEVLLAYLEKTDGINTNWHIFDVYRTAFEPRGQLMIDVLNETFGTWGNRLWKYDKRSNLENLTLNVVTIGNPYGESANKNGTHMKPTSDELVNYLKTFNLDRLNSIQKFSYAIMYPLTRIILNITLNIDTTNSWGFRNKTTNKWDGIIGMLLSGESDFSISLNAIRTERLGVIDYSGVSIREYGPCFIFRSPRSSMKSVNIFLQPFDKTVWFSLIAVVLLSAFVYYTIIHFESNRIFSLNTLSEIFLLKIGALCQQGTDKEPKKLSNRLIFLLIFLFSLTMYQFYSSSIVSGLLRPVVLNIDSVQTLEESGLDVGVEDLNIVTKMIEIYGETSIHMRKIIDKKIKPNSEYLLAKEGVKKIKNGFYAFYTDPATTYWLINDIFTEREKCDLSELYLNRPEVCAFAVQKKSPYKKLIDYANKILMETGLMHREYNLWNAKKPECVVGKAATEESLVSVEIKDVMSLLTFLFIGFIGSFTTLIIEIIVFRYNK